MEKSRCPACGAPRYRGGRCKECEYRPFTEEIAHNNHYHAGEPLVLKTPPKATRPGEGCESFSGAQIPRIPRAVWVGLAAAGSALLALALPVSIIPLILIWKIYITSRKK